MNLSPGYGETPIDPEDLDVLALVARAELGDDPTKAELYDYEQEVFIETLDTLIEQIVDGVLGVAVHAETVRVHPFVDGNGRNTRLPWRCLSRCGPSAEVSGKSTVFHPKATKSRQRGTSEVRCWVESWSGSRIFTPECFIRKLLTRARRRATGGGKNPHIIECSVYGLPP